MEIDRCLRATEHDDAVQPAALEFGCYVASGVRPRQCPRLRRSEDEDQPVGQREIRPGHGSHEHAQRAFRRQRFAGAVMPRQDRGAQAATTDEGPKYALRQPGIVDSSIGQIDDCDTTTIALHCVLLVNAAPECSMPTSAVPIQAAHGASGRLVEAWYSSTNVCVARSFLRASDAGATYAESCQQQCKRNRSSTLIVLDRRLSSMWVFPRAL